MWLPTLVCPIKSHERSGSILHLIFLQRKLRACKGLFICLHVLIGGLPWYIRMFGNRSHHAAVLPLSLWTTNSTWSFMRIYSVSNKLSTFSIQSKVDSTSRLPSKEGIELENSSRFEYPPPWSQIELGIMFLLLGLGNPRLLWGLELANTLRLS